MDLLESTSKRKTCIHIMTYSPHFKECFKLIKKIRSFDNKVTIFVILDTFEEENKFASYIEGIEVKLLNLEFITKQPLVIKQISFDDISISNRNKEKLKMNDQIAHFNYHRQYVVLKRVYSLLYLYTQNFDKIWAMDCESYPVKEIEVYSIFKKYWDNPFIVVSDNGIEYEKKLTLKVNKLFGYDYNESYKYFFRQNDLFMYDMLIFSNCMLFLEEYNNKRICDFMAAPEQMVYEIYIIKEKYNFKIINLSEHGCNLNLRQGGFGKVISQMNSTEYDKFIKNVLTKYLFCLWGNHVDSSIKNNININKIIDNIDFIVSNCPTCFIDDEFAPSPT
jgi:hypothetical protein